MEDIAALLEMDWINPDAHGFIKEDGLAQLFESNMLHAIYVKQVPVEDGNIGYVIGAQITKGGSILKMTTKRDTNRSRVFRSLDAVSAVVQKVGADSFIFIA